MPNTLLPIPHRLQRSDGDCLAACAAMALDYLGVPSDYDRLLKLLGIKPYGAPGSRLNNLTGLGVQVRYAQGSLDELIDYLGGENIAGGKLKEADLKHWRSPNTEASNISHFWALPVRLKGIR